MKICPFVSHMLGDDGPSALTLDEMSDKKSSARGKKKAEDSSTSSGRGGTATATKAPEKESPLFCIKESCRFYQKGPRECQFDQIHDMLQKVQKSADRDTDIDFSEVNREINKVWKFQTKSVSELIKSIADTEKSQSKSIEDARKDLVKNIEALELKMSGNSGAADVEKGLTTIKKKLDERHETLENLSTTMSDLVLNLHEGISQLQDRTEKMFEQMARVDRAMQGDAGIKRIIDDSLSSHLDRIEMPDMSEPVQKIERRLEQLEKRDHTTLLRKIDGRLEEWWKEQQRNEPDFEELGNKAIDDLKTQMRAWTDEIMEKLQDMKTRQQIQDERLREMSKAQDKISTGLTEKQEQRKADASKVGQKEARKFNNLGVTSFHNGAFDMARDQFLQAVKTDPGFAEAYNNLGLAYTELKEEDAATEAFRKAVQLNPSLHAAYNNLGYIYFKNEDYTKAIEMYNAALDVTADSSSAFTNLGNAYYKLGKVNKARESWAKAIEIDPGNEKAKINLRQLDEAGTDG